ncbi:MAG: NfeD family protein [Campylobacterales bacterium]|nr:NfeD family protein [Campylobacterales bacterium]
MLEMLDQNILWWHWVILGFILLVIELNTGTFFILGLAIASVLVGLLDYWLQFSFTTEILLWLAFSVVFIAIWYKKFRIKQISDSGQSNYRLDTLGTITKDITANSRGEVVFDIPVLGNTKWPATAKEDIAKDTRVVIVQINGQLIEVKSIN